MKSLISWSWVTVALACALAAPHLAVASPAPAPTPAPDNPVVTISTSMGDVTVELFPDKAPITVENFLRYVNEHFYEGTIFHRVINGFMIQGGGFTPDFREKSTHDPIKLEADNGLKNDRGTIAMARTNEPNSATSQFFINVVDNPMLNYPANGGYAVFGRVISGMDVVDKIKAVPTGSALNDAMQNVPLTPVVMTSVKVTKTYTPKPRPPPVKKPVAVISTSLGDITIELDPENAPLSTANFQRYVKEKFYDGTIFHRVINGFMIQGGGFTPALVQKPTHDAIKDEASNGLKNTRGTIAMARTAVLDSATSQFFINVKDNHFLDYPNNGGYAVFGTVIGGMDVVDKIKAVKTHTAGGMADVPEQPVVINSIRMKE